MHPVIVVGAGIGGLTLGAGLAGRGIPAVVLERAAQLAPVGAGLTVQPNAVVALRRLGIADEIERQGIPLTSAAVHAADGRPLQQLTPEQAGALTQKVGAAALGIHRATLHAALVDALGSTQLRLGAEVAGVDPGAGEVVLLSGERFRGSVIVGADGLRSAVRSALFGAAAPRYAGYYCWRGVVASNPFGPNWAGEFWGRGARFGGCAIDGARLYWFLVANGPAGGTDDDMRAAVTNVIAQFPAEIREVVTHTPLDAIRRDDISDRPPTRRWGDGCVTLLGDAAHPMTPNLGQGACQAIEDAWALTELLAARGAEADVLREYEQQRQSRTAVLVRTARRLGRVGQARGPVSTRVRDAVMRRTPSRVLIRQLETAWQLPEHPAGCHAE